MAEQAEYSAIAAIRDAVLHQRFQLAENGMTSEQVNDVLGVIDDHTPPAPAAAIDTDTLAMELYVCGTAAEPGREFGRRMWREGRVGMAERTRYLADVERIRALFAATHSPSRDALPTAARFMLEVIDFAAEPTNAGIIGTDTWLGAVAGLRDALAESERPPVAQREPLQPRAVTYGEALCKMVLRTMHDTDQLFASLSKPVDAPWEVSRDWLYARQRVEAALYDAFGTLGFPAFTGPTEEQPATAPTTPTSVVAEVSNG